MKSRTTALTTFMVMVFCQAGISAEEPVYPKLESVFQLKRSDLHDTIYFRNKDVLQGEVLNTDLVIATQYGMLKVPLRNCAGISFEGAQANTEAIVTTNYNRITGIITDRIINFRIKSSGVEIPVRKEKIRYVLLKYQPGETEFLRNHDKSDLFLMANGDLLSGEAQERKITIQTDYGKIPVSFSEMKVVQMQGGDNITAIISKTNGDTMRGTLDTEEMTLQLELGITIESIYKDKFAKIFIDEARKYAPAQFGIQQPIAGESEGAAFPHGQVVSGENLVLNLEPLLGERGTKMRFVGIPTGEFVMGSGSSEVGRSQDEGPAHKVKLSKPFYMGVFEVTQAQYTAVMGNNPSEFKGNDLPVEKVSWNDAAKFCAKMSEITKMKVTLPTEAQWEYACRAGTTTAFSFGDSDSNLGDYAWYDGNNSKRTHPVGQKKPNTWGLYDMHGNVWEWCSDWRENSYANAGTTDPQGPSSGEYRVLRGGSWYIIPRSCRSAFRYWFSPGGSYYDFGFRVVLSVSSPEFQ